MQLYASRADGHLDVGKVVGTDGTLQVSRDMGLKEPFTGTVLLSSGEIGEDFARYFAISEQIPSVVSVGVLVNTDSSVSAAGGMIIQLMPFAGEDVIEAVERVAAEMRPMSEYMSQGIEVEDLIRQLFPDAKILDHKPLRWHCDCSKEHFADALAGLQKTDLEAMINEDHGAEAECHYCRKKYRFTEEELREILEKKTRA
jgi:molecular chaperone Hsp33